MLDDGVLHPVGIGGAGAAVGFEVVDADLAAGDVGAADDEPVLLAGEGERGFVVGARDDGGEEEEENAGGFHGEDVGRDQIEYFSAIQAGIGSARPSARRIMV